MFIYNMAIALRRTVTIIVLCVCVTTICYADESSLDPTFVKSRIYALGGPRLSGDNPFRWLMKQREQIIPQLIEGLNIRNHHVAFMCLVILDRTTPCKEVRDALVLIAKNHNHNLNARATGSLRRYADNEQVKSLLQDAYADTERLKTPFHRAMIALGLDLPQEAGALLLDQLINNRGGGPSISETIMRLGEVGATTYIPGLKSTLEEIVTGPKSRNHFTVARLALADVAPTEHALTTAQRNILKEVARMRGMSAQERERKWIEFARLDRDDIRPVVMRILATRTPTPAIAILRLWQDEAALPEFEKLISENKGNRDFYASAYLEIADTDVAVDRLAELVAEDKFLYQGHIIRACMRTNIPIARKLKLARVFRSIISQKNPHTIPNVIDDAGLDTESLLIPLMAEETNIEALASYSALAARYDNEKTRAQLRRALSLAIEIAVQRNVSFSMMFSVARIMDTVATCSIADSGLLVDQLLFVEDPKVRLAAAHLAANCGGNRAKAINVLLTGLKHKYDTYRQRAAEYLIQLPPLDEHKKLEREKFILTMFGTPEEEQALRALANCAGRRTAKLLTPILDSKNIWRAIHVSWVLAHHPTLDVREKAIRRLAIVSLFWRSREKQVISIGFRIAKGLHFAQFMEGVNLDKKLPGPQSPQIPEHLLRAFAFTPAEEEFALRVYLSSFVKEFAMRTYQSDFEHEFANCLIHPLDINKWWDVKTHGINSSNVSLLRAIAKEDENLTAVKVDGKKIVHFPYRQKASALLAMITDSNTGYTGLLGETIPSTYLPPQPYANQNHILAEWLLGRLQSLLEKKDPPANERQKDLLYAQAFYSNEVLIEMCGESQFGPALAEALKAYAVEKNLLDRFKELSGFYPWSTGYFGE